MDVSIDLSEKNHWNLSQTNYLKLQQLKSANQLVLKKYPDFNTEFHLIRFMEARDWNVEKTQKMLNEYFEFRKTYDFNMVMRFDWSQLNSILWENYRSGFCHTDREGRPILYERVGQSNTKVLLNSLTLDEIRYFYIRQLQHVLHVQFPICSARAGKRIDKMILIYDFKGVNILKIFDSDFKNFLKAMAQLGQNYYPEILKMFVMVNVSLIIKGVWNTVKYLLDKKTRDKIKIFSDNGKKTLLKYISEENLPEFMGGQCKDDLREYHGPWKEELDKVKDNKKFVMDDRTHEYNYFYTPEEKNLALLNESFKDSSMQTDWSEGNITRGTVKSFTVKMKSMNNFF